MAYRTDKDALVGFSDHGRKSFPFATTDAKTFLARIKMVEMQRWQMFIKATNLTLPAPNLLYRNAHVRFTFCVPFVVPFPVFCIRVVDDGAL